jgi:hypothetical protein
VNLFTGCGNRFFDQVDRSGMGRTPSTQRKPDPTKWRPIMTRQFTRVAAASLIGLVAFAGNASAEGEGHFICQSGGITIKSVSPCYVTTYGILVPGDPKSTSGKQGGEPSDPKDLRDEPVNSGSNGKGPSEIES